MTPKQVIYPLHYLPSLIFPQNEISEDIFIKHLSEILRLPHGFIPLGRARIGIYLLVNSYVSEKRNRVLLSPYTIPDVVNMVRFAGGIPVFIDHFPQSTHIDLNYLEEKLDEQTACVLITHYHVNQESFRKIENLCNKYGAVLIEDCAISIGSKIDGHSVATQSAGGVFSFSAFKFLNYFWGGGLIASDRRIHQHISDKVKHWPRLRNLHYWPQAVRTFKFDLASQSPFFEYISTPILKKKYGSYKKEQISPAVLAESKELDETLLSRPSLGAMSELNRKVENIYKNLSHRRKIASIYSKYFHTVMVSSGTSPEVINNSCFINYPIWIDSKERNEIFRKMLFEDKEIGMSLYPNVHELPYHRSIEGKSEQVALLYRSSIYLPTHPKVTTKYAEDLVHQLKRFL